MANSSPVHVFETSFWTSQLLDNIRPNDRAKFHESIFNANPRAPGHVTSCLQLMLSRCICDCERVVECSDLYNYILVGQ